MLPLALTSVPASIGLALCFAVVVILLRRPIARWLTPRGFPGVPNVPGTLPIIGDMAFMGKLEKLDCGSTQGMGDLAKTLGPLYLIKLGFMYNILVLSDYDEIERLFFTSHQRGLEKAVFGRKMLTPILWKSIVCLATDDDWKHHIRIMGPSMTPKYLGLMMPRAVESAMELVELFKGKIDKAQGRAWAVGKDMEGAMLDAIWAVAFGESAGMIPSYRSQLAHISPNAPVDPKGATVFPSQRPPLPDSTMSVFESVSSNALYNAPLHWLHRWRPSYQRHQARLQAYLSARIADARKRAEAKGAEAAVETAGCTLDMMVARELKGEDWMSEEEMKQELLMYLVAGTETSGVLLTWWLKLMTNAPDVQRKLRQHLLDTCPEILDRPLQYDDLSATKTPYLEAVLHEALRASKTAGGFMREKDMVILGHPIPKGTGIILVGSTGDQDESHHNELPGYTPPTNAEKWKRKVGTWKAGTGLQFQPERWLDSEGKFDPNAGPSLPFGLGQRGCFGKNLALMEIRLFMAYLNVNFFLAPVTPEQNGWSVHQAVVRHPKDNYIRPVLWTSPEAQL